MQKLSLMQIETPTVASILQRLRDAIPLGTDRDRLRVALLSAARENSFLLEATFNRRTTKYCTPIKPTELAIMYPMTKKGPSLPINDAVDPFEFTDALRDFFQDARNKNWQSVRGIHLMNYMIHTVDVEDFFQENMGTLQRSDLRRLEMLVSEHEDPDAIILNELTQQIADDICASHNPISLQ